MMPRMLARPQQHTCFLQRPRNRRRRPHVRPLVNLVGHSSERTACESADGDDVRPRAVERDDHEHDKSRNRHCRHVAVRVEKAAPEEVVRVQVMHAKRYEQPRPDHRQIGAAPGIGAPVDHARRKVGDRDAPDEHERYPPLQQLHLLRDARGDRPEQNHRDDDRDTRQKKL